MYKIPNLVRSLFYTCSLLRIVFHLLNSKEEKEGRKNTGRLYLHSFVYKVSARSFQETVEEQSEAFRLQINLKKDNTALNVGQVHLNNMGGKVVLQLAGWTEENCLG